jgi:hypothetical protein
MLRKYTLRTRTLASVIWTLWFVAAVAASSASPLRVGSAAGQQIPATTIPFSVVDGRILIQVRLNGHGPFRMLFDSGASAVVSRDIAKQLALPLSSAHKESGTGNQVLQVENTTAQTVALGSSQIGDIPFDVMTLEDMPPVFGTVKIDGILGRPIFDRFVVQVNYDKQILTLFEPSLYRPSPADIPLSFTRVRDVPLVAASLDGHAGLFGVDLGARSSILLNGWFAEDDHMESLFEGAPEIVLGWGLGGAIHGKLGRAHEFDIASIKVESPIVRLSTQRSGLLSKKDTAGLIGADILRQFTLTFDPVRQVVYFQRSESFGARTEFDKSGKWIVPNNAGFKVIDLVTGGAAERAGIRVDDDITRVNGLNFTDIILPDLRESWSKLPAGTVVKLQIKRHQAVLRKTLKLKSLV